MRGVQQSLRDETVASSKPAKTPDVWPQLRARPLDALPLAALILVSVSVALAIDVGYGGAVGMTLHASIGFLLCALAVLKLMDFRRFADGFALFDIIATRWRPFAYAWPIFELALGEAYFTFLNPPVVYWLTRGMGLYLIVGVLLSARRGLDRNDARLCNALKLPLCTLMLVEGTIMLLMSNALLWL